MSIKHVFRIQAFIAIVLFPGMASAITPSLTINGSSNSNVGSCSGNLTVRGSVSGTVYGTNKFSWTLYRSGVVIKTASETLTCDNTPWNCQLPYFAYSAPPVSGTYKLMLEVLFTKGISNEINVSISASGSMPKPRINGNAADNVDVCPVGPIILDGSQSICASNYFVGIQLSDQWAHGKGDEFNQWLTSTEYNKYGPISAFDIKRWAEARWFIFTPGQYYRVKLAVGPVWQEKVQVIFIKTPVSVSKINGQAAQKVDILKPDYPIIMDGSASTCASPYFVSVQLSDASWNRYGPEAMRWLNFFDFLRYGSINHFDVKRFAQDQWFIFSPGQYYRVKLAVGPGWQETSTLIYIKP